MAGPATVVSPFPALTLSALEAKTMNARPHYLLLLLIFLPACLFTVDEAQLPESDPDTPDNQSTNGDAPDNDTTNNDDETNDDETPTSPITLSGPSSPIVVTNLGALTLSFQFHCQGDQCTDDWTCVLTQGDDSAELSHCASPLQLDDQTFDEGRFEFAVEMIATTGDTYQESTHTTVLKNFQITAEALASTTLDGASDVDIHVLCDHPRCHPQCQWLDADDDPLTDPTPCPANEDAQLEVPVQDDLQLRASACIQDLPGLSDDHHCRQSDPLSFEP